MILDIRISLKKLYLSPPEFCSKAMLYVSKYYTTLKQNKTEQNKAKKPPGILLDRGRDREPTHGTASVARTAQYDLINVTYAKS